MKAKLKTRTVEEILAKLDEMTEIEQWTKDIMSTHNSAFQIEGCQVALSIIRAYISALKYCLNIDEEK